jgi:hypothetical protein
LLVHVSADKEITRCGSEDTYPVRVKLELSSQDSVSDVVDKVGSAHLTAAAEEVEAKATIRIVLIPDGTCCRIDDTSHVGKVLYRGRRGDGGGDQNDARDEHRVEQCADLMRIRKHIKLTMRRASNWSG